MQLRKKTIIDFVRNVMCVIYEDSILKHANPILTQGQAKISATYTKMSLKIDRFMMTLFCFAN